MTLAVPFNNGQANPERRDRAPDTGLRVCTSDPELRRRWSAAFDAAGWTCAFSDGLRALAEAAPGPGSVAIVCADLLAREGDPGLQSLRAAGVAYIVSGCRGVFPEDAVIRLLEAGADDFIDADADPRLVVAKLRAHMRRRAARPVAKTEVLLSPKRGVKCDPGRRSACVREEAGWREMDGLTLTEFELLALFLRRPGHALPRHVILESVWGEQAGAVNPETVDKHVEALRRKLGKAGQKIRTLYGVGYAFHDE